MIVLLQVTTVILISLFQFNSCQYEEEEKLKNKFKTYIEDVEDQRPRIPIKQIYANLKTTISSVKKSCGQVCDQSVPGIPGKYYDFIEKKVDCKSIFSNPDIDDPAQFLDPPTRIPKWLAPEYTYGGRVDIANFYRDDAQGQSHYTNWTLELDEYILEMYRKKQLTGPYGKDAVDNIINYIKTQVDVKDKHVLVLGSQTPWIELILLEHGAKKVTAVDYIKIHSEHEQIEAMTAYELNEKYLKGTLPQYDVYVSFSSLEHAGLGRYGDNLNPWGDLIAMARAWCITKPGGKALIGVPAGPDRIVFNSHKIYGPIMFSHLFANWKQIYTDTDLSKFSEKCDHCYQPLHVLERLP